MLSSFGVERITLSSELNEEQIKMADLDNSGNINVADALALQKLIIGLL